MMEIGNVIRGTASRLDIGIVTGEIISILEKTYIVSTGKEREVIRKGVAELVSKKKITEKRCTQCGEMLELDRFRNLKNDTKDKVCKGCGGNAIRKGLKKEGTVKKIETKPSDKKESTLVEIESIKKEEKLIEMISEEACQCVRVGKGFLSINLDEPTVNIHLDPLEASDINDLETAKQVAEDFGGEVIEVVTHTFIRASAK